MTAPMEPVGAGDVPVIGHTRWGRVAGALVPALLALIVLAVVLQQQVLAASLVPGGVPLTLAIEDVDALGVGVVGMGTTTASGDLLEGVLVGIGKGRIYQLCAALPMPIGAGFALQATGPSIVGTDLALGADDLTGDSLVFESIVIGRDASSLQATSVVGAPGMNGIEADRLLGEALRARAFTVEAATFDMTGLTLGVTADTGGC